MFVRLGTPRIGNSEDAYGLILAYLYWCERRRTYVNLYNEHLLDLRLARKTTSMHTYGGKFKQ